MLSRLWTKVQEIFGQYRRPIVLSYLVRLSVSRFVQKIFTISVEIVQNRTNAKVSWSLFFLGDDPNRSTAVLRAV